MSTAQFTCPLIVVIPGQVIAASLWNGEFQNIFTNLNPLGVGAYSDTDPQMQIQTDPFPSGSTSRPTSLGGELERIRFVLAEITGNSFWYQVPNATIAEIATDIVNVNARFPIQTVDIGDLQVTDAKINDVAFGKITGTITPSDGTVTTPKIVDANVTTNKIADANVTTAKLATTIGIINLNVVTALTFAGFNILKILQIVTASTSTQTSTTSIGFTVTNLTGSITPKINTSKILVVAIGTLAQGSGTDDCAATLARNGTNLSGSAIGMVQNTAGNTDAISLVFYDSPATLSTTTYAVYIRTRAGNAAVRFPAQNTGFNTTPEAQLIMIEIAQ